MGTEESSDKALENLIHRMDEMELNRYSDPLTGLFGHLYNSDNKIERQFLIKAKIEQAVYLVQWFGWIVGEPTTLGLLSAEDLMFPKAELYQDAKQWREKGQASVSR